MTRRASLGVGKRPLGSANPHVQKSQGADTNIMKFYVTQNSTAYGQNWSTFKPRGGRHVGTGYLANFRPGVYYSQQLDRLDNPTMGRIVSRNYMTVHQRDFRPYRDSDGTDPLPYSVHQVESGFIREKPISCPTRKEVDDVYIDRRAVREPTDFLPRHRPGLAGSKGKDPVEAENGHFGPGYMTTETHERFKGLPSDRMDVSRKTVGPNEETGFTHAQNIEPITFHPDYAHKGDLPGYWTDRPTGISIMKTSFCPYKTPHGDEVLPVVANRSVREDGFTKGTKAMPVYVNRVPSDAYDKAGDMHASRVAALRKKDPAEYMNAIHPNNYSSLATDFFKGRQNPVPSESDRLGRTKTGGKEMSGYTENNDRFVKTADDVTRFTTHYKTRFYPKEPFGLDREGHCRGGVQEQLPDGFTKSTAIHSNGPDVDTTATLRRLAPYPARSIKARDPFYDDHIHDSKVRFTLPHPPSVPTMMAA